MVFVFKFVLVGDKNAGKSSLMKRYAEGTFVNYIPRETEVRQVVKSVAVRGEIAKLQICEISNQDNAFKPNNCYRGAHAILLLFNLSDCESCQSIPIWLEEISRYCYGNVKVILVGTKADTLFSTNPNKSCTNNNTTYIATNNKNNVLLNTPNNSNCTNNINLSNCTNNSNNTKTSNCNNINCENISASLATLPIEILDHVFSHLDVRSLLFACFVNWDWYKILNSQEMWQRLYKRDFKLPTHYTDWKTAYIQKYLATWSSIHKAREYANQYGLPLVLTSARTALNVSELFSEIAHMLFDKVKQSDQQQQDEAQSIPRACTVMLKEKGHNTPHSHSLFKNYLTPHRIQISDSKLFVRGIETTAIKHIIPGKDIVSVYIDEHYKKPNVALKLHTRQGNNYTFVFESQSRAEMWRVYITNM